MNFIREGLSECTYAPAENLEFLKWRRLLLWPLIKGGAGKGLALFRQF